MYGLKMRLRNYRLYLFQGSLVLLALMSTSVEGQNTTPAASVPPPTVLTTVDSNSTMMSSNTSSPPPPMPMLECWSFHCYGAQCYQNESTYMRRTMMPPVNSTMMPPMNSTTMPPMNSTMMPPSMKSTCVNGTFCELFRDNRTHFMGRCSSQCTQGINACMVNGTLKDNCTMDCCNTSLCIKRNGTVYGDLLLPTVAPTTATTTATPFPGNGKYCRTFTCDGADCFKGKDTKLQCKTGNYYCELKKKFTSSTAVSFTAGCSSTCRTGAPSCAGATAGECYQECCNATASACCLLLDGGVHLNGASQLSQGSLLKLLAWAAIVILSSRLSVRQQI